MISRNEYLKREMIAHIKAANEYIYFGMFYSAKTEIKSIVTLFENQFCTERLVVINMESPYSLLSKIHTKIKDAYDIIDKGNGYFSAIHLKDLSELLEKFH